MSATAEPPEPTQLPTEPTPPAEPAPPEGGAGGAEALRGIITTMREAYAAMPPGQQQQESGLKLQDAIAQAETAAAALAAGGAPPSA